MTTYTQRELYGGAITVQLPKDYIDSSDLRQIPDHQEVFLSPTTLTSIIFEINQFVYSNQPNTTEAATAAVQFHFTDVISPPDHLAVPLPTPTPTTLPSGSLSTFPAFVVEGEILSPEIDRTAAANSTLPIEWQQTPQTKDARTQVFQLVVRMAKYDTDLCVRVNIPLKELLSKGEQDRMSEELFAQETLQRIVQTLDVKDFGLFGAE